MSDPATHRHPFDLPLISGVRLKIASIAERDAKLSNGAKLLFGTLLREYMNGETGRCNPGTGTLAGDMRRSKPTIERLRHELVDNGWLQTFQDLRDDLSDSSIRYRVPLTLLETYERDLPRDFSINVLPGPVPCPTDAGLRQCIANILYFWARWDWPGRRSTTKKLLVEPLGKRELLRLTEAGCWPSFDPANPSHMLRLLLLTTQVQEEMLRLAHSGGSKGGVVMPADPPMPKRFAPIACGKFRLVPPAAAEAAGLPPGVQHEACIVGFKPAKALTKAQLARLPMLETLLKDRHPQSLVHLRRHMLLSGPWIEQVDPELDRELIIGLLRVVELWEAKAGTKLVF